MKKTVTSIALVFVLCLSLCFSAWAADTDFIFDEVGALSDADIELLNEQAQQLSDEIDCDLLYIYTEQSDFYDFAGDAMPGTRENRILMVENAEEWQMLFLGDAEQYITDDDAWDLRALFHDDDPQSVQFLAEYISDYLYAAAEFVVPTADSSAVDAQTYGAVTGAALSRLADTADILTDAEEAALLAQLDEVSTRQQFDVVLVTVTDTGDKSLMEYADDYFDYNGFGFGEDRDGVLYLLRVDADGTYSTGNSWISTSGLGIEALTDADIQSIGEAITPDLLQGDYAAAISQYIAKTDSLVTIAREGAPFNAAQSFVFSLVIGLIVAFVGTGSMKKKLKTVHQKATASDYLKPGSLQLMGQSDVFLYSNVTRTARPKETDSGGSSTHTSSSGRTHGGGGF